MRDKLDQQAFERLDHHIRSASSLAQILWSSGDAPAGFDENVKQRPDFVIDTLNDLAQCLVRLPKETVAAGLLEGRSTVVVGNSPHGRLFGTSDSKESEQFDNEELHHGGYAMSTPNPDDAGPNVLGEYGETVGYWERIYSYHTASQKSKYVSSLDHTEVSR